MPPPTAKPPRMLIEAAGMEVKEKGSRPRVKGGAKVQRLADIETPDEQKANPLLASYMCDARSLFGGVDAYNHPTTHYLPFLKKCLSHKCFIGSWL